MPFAARQHASLHRVLEVLVRLLQLRRDRVGARTQGVRQPEWTLAIWPTAFCRTVIVRRQVHSQLRAQEMCLHRDTFAIDGPTLVLPNPARRWFAILQRRRLNAFTLRKTVTTTMCAQLILAQTVFARMWQ